MNILILGAGQVGSNVAYQLAREEANQVTIVDIDPAALRELQDRLDVRTVVGHAAYPDVLERAGANARLAPFLITGVLGGFTTFSAFSLDAVGLVERGRVFDAALYIAGSAGLSILALVAGLAIARAWLA